MSKDNERPKSESPEGYDPSGILELKKNHNFCYEFEHYRGECVPILYTVAV